MSFKKGEQYTGIVEKVKFPNKGVVRCDDNPGYCIVKNVVMGQKITFMVSKKRGENAEGRLISVLEKSPVECDSDCPHFDECGGCAYRNIPYEEQLKLKQNQVYELLKYYADDECFMDIKGSPMIYGYRNKMEFSFGDGYMGGPLELGLHKRGSFYDILTVRDCRIIDDDYRKILTETLGFFRNTGIPFYHKLRHEGVLRHLLIRKAVKTGEILVDLISASKIDEEILKNYVNLIKGLSYDGELVGILNTINTSLSDTIRDDGTDILFGCDYFYEELLGLNFKITPFSFFQTNSYSAEVLYDTVRKLAGGTINNNVIYDLYSGTGTIAQLLAGVAKKVIGVEIIPEAVLAAKENAALNGLHNCDFIAGDVLKVIDDIEDKPDYIVLDPPRDGIHPKALPKILSYGVENIIYISCKPTSLARDLPEFIKAGYKVLKVCPVDQFPYTGHVETVCLLSKLHEAKHHVSVKLDMDEMDITSAESKATYEEIKKYVAEHNDGMKVSSLNIAQVKRKCGLELVENHNLPKSEDARQPQCPKEKEEAIVEALKTFKMV